MRVYHFLPRTYGLEDLRKRRLKIATLGDINDPFELLSPVTYHPSERRALRAMKAEFAADHGLLCFSRDWRNPVQWSHYAEGHRGLCLAFDCPDTLLIPVNYVTVRQKLDLGALMGSAEPAERYMQRLLSTKYVHWSYEDEVRCFTDLVEKEGEFYFAPFSSDLELKEVIVGHSSTITRAELADALGTPSSHVSTRKARLAFKTYKVVTQRMRSLWR